MKTTVSHLTLAATLSAGLFGASPVLAEFSANAALTSNYVFRGVSYSDEGPALQGGLDYAHASGAYAGLWGSTVDTGVDTGVEVDGYFGYAASVEDFSYDVGYINYANNDSEKLGNFISELYAKGGYKMFSAGLYFGQYHNTPKDEYSYFEVGASVPELLPYGMAIDLHYGITSPDVGEDVNDLLVGVSGEYQGLAYALAYTSEDATDEDYVVLTLSKDFAL